MQLESGVSVERKCYIYNISISLCPSFYLHIYSGVPRGGGGRGRILQPLTTFKNRVGSSQNIVGKFFKLPLRMSIEIHSTSSCRHFFLPGLSILWKYRGILSSKQNHKLQHTKAASTKPHRRIKFIFCTSPHTFPVSAYHCIDMYM